MTRQEVGRVFMLVLGLTVGLLLLGEGSASGHWSGLGAILLSVYVFGIGNERRTAVNTALKTIFEDFEPVFELSTAIVKFIVGVVLTIGLSLAGIYLLVRFVKWAWTD